MLNATRIKRLFLKDLLDILRDRRTLITLIVVPLVLYPGLMLCFIQLGSIQAGRLKQQRFLIGVNDPFLKDWLGRLTQVDAAMLKDTPEEDRPPGIYESEIIVKSAEELRALVAAGTLHVAAIVERPTDPRVEQLRLDVIKDSSEIRSEIAEGSLRAVLTRFAEDKTEQVLGASGYGMDVIRPVVISEIDVATAVKRGGSLLGQILPLVLILMTITGAIYPAIDLTAGERERGTLETLLVCPIPISEIIIGKFLVVVIVSLLGATLNLASMGLTIQFGGLKQALEVGGETEVPFAALPVVLLCLVPLAVLSSALLLAVSSYAKTFKEAQSYVTPVIIMALMPAGIAALPGVELTSTMMVLPVANMVLLTRELLVGTVTVGTVLIVVLSTALYAAAAVGVAIRVFGQEAVLFSDAGSWRSYLGRGTRQVADRPKPVLALIYVAVLFPTWFYVQSGLQLLLPDQFTLQLIIIQILMVALFAIGPMVVLRYFGVRWRTAFGWRWPSARALIGALLVGAGTWALGHELLLIQRAFGFFGVSDAWLEQFAAEQQGLLGLPPVGAIVLLAIVPAVCEELFFRGMLLGALRNVLWPWTAILVVALIFAAFHYFLQRFALTYALGALLGYVAWQTGSLLPCIVIHLMHNGIMVVAGLPFGREAFHRLLGMSELIDDPLAHLPAHIITIAASAVIAGLLIMRTGRQPDLQVKPG